MARRRRRGRTPPLSYQDHLATQRQGSLPARTEKVSGRDGRPVIKTLIRASALDDASGWTAREDHVRKIRASAPPMTDEQKVVIRNVFLDHLLEREAKGRSPRTDGTTA